MDSANSYKQKKWESALHDYERHKGYLKLLEGMKSQSAQSLRDRAILTIIELEIEYPQLKK